MSKKISLWIGVGVLALSLSACTSTTTATNTPAGTKAPSTAAVSDPLTQVSNAKSDFYIGKGTKPVLHTKKTGPSTLSVERPASYVKEFKFFVTCSPSSKFTVTMKKFYAGPCSPSSVASSGAIPIPAGTGPLTVTVDVPKGTQYWLLAVPIQ